MEVLDGEDTAERVENLVHFDTQRANTGIDLTVGAVYTLEGAGQLDFGGSEFDEASTRALEPTEKHPEDDYGWWTLEAGYYLIEYNEGFVPDDGEFGIVRPLPRLLRAGTSHATFHVDSEQPTLSALIDVGPQGIEMKENFRASRLQVYRRD